MKDLSPPIRWVAALVRVFLGAPTRTLRGTARLIADPTRQVTSYWRSEKLTIRQAFNANIVSTLTSLIAGLTLKVMEGRITAIEGLFILIPVSIGMRGNIFGALAARLGSSIHSGLFVVSGNRQGMLYQNAYAAGLLTISTSALMGLLARAVASLLGIHTISVWEFVAIAVVGGLLSSAIVLAFTVFLSITGFRRGWDLDSVGAVLITTVGDVVTLPCLFLASYVVDVSYLSAAIAMLALAAALVLAVRGWLSPLPMVKRIVRESLPILSLAIVLDILAGTSVQPRLEETFIQYGALLILLPGFLENTGALGSILAARLGSKLHLGVITPTARPGAPALLDASVVFGLGVAVYSLTAFSTLGISMLVGASFPGAFTFLGVVLLAGLMATLIAAFIGYYAAVGTYRFGLDPDNHTIPLVTSGMDLLGVACVVIALNVFSVV